MPRWTWRCWSVLWVPVLLVGFGHLAPRADALRTGSQLRRPWERLGHQHDEAIQVNSYFLQVLFGRGVAVNTTDVGLNATERAAVEEFIKVQHTYEIAWASIVLALALLTLLFYLLKKPWLVKEDSFATKSSGVGVGDSEEVALVQTGYVHTPLGDILFFMWATVPAAGYVQMVIFAVDHYIYAMHFTDQTWLNLAEPFLLVFFISHAVLFFQAAYGFKARVFFMQPAPMENASQVLLEEENAGSYACMLVDVKIEDEVEAEYRQMNRYYEYTCVRYLWNEGERSFRPSGAEFVARAAARARVKDGGLQDAEVKRRRIAGLNSINIEVPSLITSTVNEFLSGIYIFQFSCIWIYMFYSTWNIASIWLVLALASGSTKAYLVRRNQLQIREMAATETEATVLRGGEWLTVGSAQVVPGDIVRIENGVVPCDVIILEGYVVVNESMLTGEPMPIQRFAVGEGSPDDLLEASSHSMKRNIIYAGTQVMQTTGGTSAASGCAVGLALAIGARTAKGSLVRMVLFPTPTKFKFTDQLPTVYVIMCAYVVCLFLLQMLKDQGHWIVAVFTGLCLLTQSLQPNMPVSFTLAHNLSASRLKSQCGIMCLSPERTPLAGKVHVMVLDKTGTITKEGMDFAGVHPASERLGEPFSPLCHYTSEDGKQWRQSVPPALLWTTAACNTVTQMDDGNLVGNAVEVAMLKASGWSLAEGGAYVRASDGEVTSANGGETELRFVRRLEFDHSRMTSGAVVQLPASGKTVVLIKGSYERVQQLTSGTRSTPSDFEAVTQHHAAEQYYILGVGMKELTAEEASQASRDDLEKDIFFVGLLLFRNEVKPDSPQALTELRAGGVRCVMCTGDNALTGLAVSRWCSMLSHHDGVLIGDVDVEGKDGMRWTSVDGATLSGDAVFSSESELVLTGAAFRRLCSDGRIDEILERVRVYARMKPEDKVKVIELHQARGWIVGMAGDGGNDCGALRTAHVGLALSEAEASIVAPFSSGSTYGTDCKSLRALPDLLRFGRATLATNLATYMYFMVYALSVPFAKFVLLFLGNMTVSEWAWLLIDIGVGSFMVAVMTLNQPAEALADLRPTASLLGFRTVATVLMPVCIYIVFASLAEVLLHRQPFYLPYDSVVVGVPGHEWQKKGDNYDSAVGFFFLALQLPTTAFVFSFGAEFRRGVAWNVTLMICYVCVIAFFVVLLWGGPSELHCIMRVNCDSHTSQHMYVPIVHELSTGNVGGCFLGPQLMDYKERFGVEYVVPDDAANGCNPHPSVNVTKDIRTKSFSLPGLGAPECIGPNNCFDHSFRLTMTLLLAAMVLLTFLFGTLMSRFHPAKKEHFKRL